MNILDVIKLNLKKLFDFKGRLNRKDFIIYFIFTCVLSYAIQAIIILILSSMTPSLVVVLITAYAFLMMYVIELVLIFSASVRRLHDTGKSGWIILLNLVPVLGSILVLIFLLSSSENQNNSYGQLQASN